MRFEEAQQKLDHLKITMGDTAPKRFRLLVAPTDKAERDSFLYRVENYENGEEMALRAVMKKDFDVYGYEYHRVMGLSVIYDFAEPENILVI